MCRNQAHTVDSITFITHILLFVALYTEVFLLVAFMEGSPRTKKSQPSRYPSVTVIVPCFNEEKTISSTLQSLLALEYPQHLLSIIAVNDGSTDSTQKILETFSHDSRITILSQENGGKYTAMNAALRHSKSEIIGCLDADSFVRPDALKNAVAHFESRNADAVTPAITVTTPDSLLGYIQQAEYTLSIFIRRAFDMTGTIFVTPGPFSLFRRTAIVELGGWRHAHGTEDMDIAMRMQEHGMKIVNAPDVYVTTTAPRTLKALFKQRTRWAYGGIMNFWDFRHMVGNRKHGALGVVILPSVIISIFAALFFTAQLAVLSLQNIASLYVKIDTIGLALHWPSIPELFFINTSSITIVSLVLILLVLVLVYIGKTISGTPLHPLALPVYLVLYPLIAPWWLGNAAARAALRIQAPWR